MAYYRFDPSGVPVLDRLERLKTMYLHMQSWGVQAVALKMTAAVVWVQTTTDIPADKLAAIETEVGFPCTRTINEPTTA